MVRKRKRVKKGWSRNFSPMEAVPQGFLYKPIVLSELKVSLAKG